MGDFVFLERSQGILRATCAECRATITARDKGMGRATIAAWRTHHQHPDATAPEARA